LRTFGCRVHVRPTTACYGRMVPNSRLGIFLGYSRTLSVLYTSTLNPPLSRRLLMPVSTKV
jgi:hypothetical protein